MFWHCCCEMYVFTYLFLLVFYIFLCNKTGPQIENYEYWHLHWDFYVQIKNDLSEMGLVKGDFLDEDKIFQESEDPILFSRELS